jgi:hypothetical protein
MQSGSTMMSAADEERLRANPLRSAIPHGRMIRYLRPLRPWLLTLAMAACSKEAAAPKLATRGSATPAVTTSDAAAGALPAHQAYPDLGAALVATIPADARVVGFGELHARTDRAAVASSLARFTQALPAIAGKLSDLIIETWLVDPACGTTAVQATSKVETTMKRPEATKSEIAQLADAARAAHIQPHAMTLNCTDYAAITPADHDVDPVAILTLTTRELTRIATSAVLHRDKDPSHRPWIAVYGGALHNDRFPDRGVAEWSYAAEVDRVTGGHFVEIDVIVPELAEADPLMQHQPWLPLARAARDPANPVLVWKRGERSFVVLLPPT